jgi:hypothetical protein
VLPQLQRVLELDAAGDRIGGIPTHREHEDIGVPDRLEDAIPPLDPATQPIITPDAVSDILQVLLQRLDAVHVLSAVTNEDAGHAPSLASVPRLMPAV